MSENPEPASKRPFPSAEPAAGYDVSISDHLNLGLQRVSSDELLALVAGSSAFALDLYAALRAAPGNLFFSPYSISVALAMTYAGARERTEAQMARTLHFSLDQERLHPAFNALNRQMAGRGEAEHLRGDAGLRLNIANAIWAQQGYDFLAPFLDTLALNYGAGLYLLDFAGAPEPSRLTINQWVSSETGGRITDLIPAGTIDPLTRLVLTNAIYFKAAWDSQFQAQRTQDAPFYLLDGRPVDTPQMHQVGTFSYAAGPGVQAVQLPYSGRELAMLILLPDAGQFASFEEALDETVVQKLVSDLAGRRLDLRMPRFKVMSRFDLGANLAALGMPDAFNSNADFSGMEPRRELSISAVVHQAWVDVDEEGTEAAAATAVIIMTKAMLPADPLAVTIDRPFIFLIRDTLTGTILFAGRVLDPTADS